MTLGLILLTRLGQVYDRLMSNCEAILHHPQASHILVRCAFPSPDPRILQSAHAFSASFQWEALAPLASVGVVTTLSSFGEILAQRIGLTETAATVDGRQLLSYNIAPLCEQATSIIHQVASSSASGSHAQTGKLQSLVLSQILFRPASCEVLLTAHFLFEPGPEMLAQVYRLQIE
jgi:hypothetical protein